MKNTTAKTIEVIAPIFAGYGCLYDVAVIKSGGSEGKMRAGSIQAS
jgi:hypothetical protein